MVLTKDECSREGRQAKHKRDPGYTRHPCSATGRLGSFLVSPHACRRQFCLRYSQIILVGVVLLIGLGLAQAFPYFDPHNILASAELFRQSAAGRILLAPFEVFPRIMTAEGVGELLLWGTIGLGMVAGLFALAVILDVNYLETAQYVSQRVYERLQRMRQGGGGAIGTIQIRGAHRIRSPRLPWLFGLGPNLWRQWLLLEDDGEVQETTITTSNQRSEPVLAAVAAVRSHSDDYDYEVRVSAFESTDLLTLNSQVRMSA